VSPRTGAGGSGRFSAGTRDASGRRGLSRSEVDTWEIRVVGVDPGARAFLNTGGSSRF